MKGTIATLFLLPVLFWACTKPGNKIYVLSNNAAHLKPGDTVSVSGLPIGTITGITLLKDYRLVMELEINEGIKIPVGSDFKVSYTDLEGPRHLKITPSKNSTYMNIGDTAVCNVEVRTMRTDSALMLMMDKLDSLLKN